MSYDEACPFAPSTGCASYIHARLIESLEVGSVYEATMWVYFPKDMNEDSAILHNIGFYLSLSPEDVGVHDLLKTDFSLREVFREMNGLKLSITYGLYVRYKT